MLFLSSTYSFKILLFYYFRFIGGEMNTCYEIIDKHVEDGHGDQVGLIYDSPLLDFKKSYTYKELQNEVRKCSFRLSCDKA